MDFKLYAMRTQINDSSTLRLVKYDAKVVELERFIVISIEYCNFYILYSCYILATTHPTIHPSLQLSSFWFRLFYYYLKKLAEQGSGRESVQSSCRRHLRNGILSVQ